MSLFNINIIIHTCIIHSQNPCLKLGFDCSDFQDLAASTISASPDGDLKGQDFLWCQ